MKLLFIFLMPVCLTYFVESAVDVRCSEAFCKTYRSTPGCSSLGDACRIQNSTHNGLLLSSATPCNCCEICLTYLFEGDICSVGQPGSPAPKSMCGPGLFCKSRPDNEHPLCEPMSTDSDCYSKQIEFDKRSAAGLTGNLEIRPLCDGSGYYEPVKCIPGQICYCLSKDGDRIFGEAFYSHSTSLIMKCECSRLVYEANKLLSIQDRPISASRCSSIGNYESLQCIGDICVCVNVNSGAPVSNALNKTTSSLTELDCFDSKINNNETFYNPCESKQMEILKEIEEFELEGYSVLDFQLNLCQYDGWYERLQTKEDKKVCVDKYGKQIETFSADASLVEGREMNCNCARTLRLMEEGGSLELPECMSNGNFPSITCRRGFCYNTDIHGQQVGKEFPRHQTP